MGRIIQLERRAWQSPIVSRIDALIAQLEAPDPSTRFEATELLGRTRSIDAVEPLMRATADASLLVRMGAINALGDLGELAAAAIPAIVGAMRDAGVVRNALVAFARIGVKADVIREKLDDPSLEIRAAAAEALWKTERDPAVLAVMLEAMDQGSLDARIAAARVLGEIGDRSALPPLVSALDDHYPEIRREAAIAVGKLGGDPRLEDLLDDPIDAVRLEAALAVKSDRAVEVLAQIAAPGEGSVGWEDEGAARFARRPKEPSLRAAALRGLASLGKAAAPALPVIHACLADDDDEIRAAVTLALAAVK